MRLKYLKHLKRLALGTALLGSVLTGQAADGSSPASGIVAMEDSITKIYHNIVGTMDADNPLGMDSGFSWFQRAIFNLEEMPTDESKWIWDPATYGGIIYGNVVPNDVVILGPWLRMTHVIARCNSFINQDFDLTGIADETERAEALRQREEYVRQALTLRSGMYFYLLSEYGNVPYCDETMAAPGEQLSADLATGRRLVTEKVIATLEDIVAWYKANDPDNVPVYGHVGVDVAEALLVKFYLNHEVFTGTPAWDKVLAHAKAIIARRGNGGFMGSGLAMNYTQNFSYNNRTAADNEIIWRIATMDPDGTKLQSYSNGTFMLLANIASSYGEFGGVEWNTMHYNSYDGWRCMVGLRQLTDAFEWNYETKKSPDQRVAWWGTAKQGFAVDNYSLMGDNWGKNGFIPVKFTNWNINDDGSVDIVNVPDPYPTFCIDYGMIRLAEIYLSAAEAILHGAGDMAEALTYTNYVRQRAGMPAFTSLDMETLQAERQRELYTECNRRTDLIRYGKWISGYDWNWKAGARTGRDYDPNFIVYPIPTLIVEQYGYTQNPLPATYEVEAPDVDAPDWKIVGSFCDFDAERGISMQPQGEGSYLLTMPTLEGSFKFVTADPWDFSQLGNGDLRGTLNGNVDISLNNPGSYIETDGKLTDVKLLLYPYARVLRVMGLEKNQSYEAAPAEDVTLYLRGDINGWSADPGYMFTYEGDGKYTLKVAELEGSFKFADEYWSSANYGAKQTDMIMGNCTVGTGNGSYTNFNAPGKLSSVEILLDVTNNKVTFSGLPNNQDIPEYDPNVQSYGYFLLDGRFEYMSAANPGAGDAEAVWELRHRNDGEQCYISRADIVEGMPLAWRRKAVEKYLYGTQTAEKTLVDGTEIQLEYPAHDAAAGCFEFEEEGDFRLTLDLATDVLSVEAYDPALYICGDVWSENGVFNGFMAPTQSNKEIYDREFVLTKIGDVYQGKFKMGDYKDTDSYPDKLPQFRFFTQLAGWTNEYSLGSYELDFYCLPITLEHVTTLPIVDHGLGNWGIDAPGQWVYITVDLDTMEVTFFTEEAWVGVDDVVMDAQDAQPVWYNLQGIKVERPEKGIYIKVTGDKKEKVIL